MRDVCVLDLDGSLTLQSDLFENLTAKRIDARDWGPRIRLACSFRRFRQFERWLDASSWPAEPCITGYGSGDFHHVTLALLRRISEPFNLLVLDKHPDWMRGIPFLHCGTWLRHALRLSQVNRVFHCGGELDFDNAYRWLAPWSEIESGKIVVLPCTRVFVKGRWAKIKTQPLVNEDRPISEVLAGVVGPLREELSQRPLYISIDKDVLTAEDAAVNWDSGSIRLPEAVTVVKWFVRAAGGRMAGADLLGDWSPIELGHGLNRLCDRIDHPSPRYQPEEAAQRNRRANEALLRALQMQAS
jgi:hypothetical protein